MIGSSWRTSIQRIGSLAAPLTCAALVACGPRGGTDVGNGRTVELELSSYSKPAAAAQAINLDDGVVVEQVYLVIAKVSLAPGGTQCEANNEVDLEGPFVADLTGGGILGGAPTFPKLEDTFCEFLVGYRQLEPDDAPADAPASIIGRSVFVRGTTADGRVFTIASERDDEVELKPSGGGTFGLTDGTNRLVLAYEIQAWINAAKLNGLTDDPIVIDSDTNADRLADFDKAVENSARLFRDANGDGVLSPSELANPIALPEGE